VRDADGGMIFNPNNLEVAPPHTLALADDKVLQESKEAIIRAGREHAKKEIR
jgi:hypothetical protein